MLGMENQKFGKGIAVCGRRMHHVLVRSLAFVVVSLTFVMLWEGTRPLLEYAPGAAEYSSAWESGRNGFAGTVLVATQYVASGSDSKDQRRLQNNWNGNSLLNASKVEISHPSRIQRIHVPPRYLGDSPTASPSPVSPFRSLEFEWVARRKVGDGSKIRARALDVGLYEELQRREESPGPGTARALDSQNGDHNVGDLARSFDIKRPRLPTILDNSSVFSLKAGTECADVLKLPVPTEKDVQLESTRDFLMKAVPRAEPTICDYSTGYWVKDPEKRTLYSGKDCKRFLSRAWSCRLNARPDFAYEDFRWQPKGCDLPRFNAKDFLARMRNKILAFLGDSLGQQQFQSLMCMLSEGLKRNHVKDIGDMYNFAKEALDTKPTGWAYKFKSTNTTILFYWSATLCAVDEGSENVSGHKALHLDRPVSFLTQYFHTFDVMIFNTGHHWNRGKFDQNNWHMHINGLPIADRRQASMGFGRNFSLHSLTKWLDDESKNTGHKPVTYLRSLSPRHFKNGEWDSGGVCEVTNPLLGKDAKVSGPSKDIVSESAVQGTHVHYLNITYLSQFREEAHISKYGFREKAHKVFNDCLHWCLPGVPDVWNELFYSYYIRDHPGSGT